MDKAVIQADFADFRQVKGRKVAQLIMEMPLESLSAAMDALGWPKPETSLPVAIARLQPAPVSAQRSAETIPVKQARSFKDLPRSAQAGIRLQDPSFQSWLGCESRDEANDALMRKIGVSSKKDLDADPCKGRQWDALLTDFDVRNTAR